MTTASLFLLFFAPAAAFVSHNPAAVDLLRTRRAPGLCAMLDLGSEGAFDQAVKVVPRVVLAPRSARRPFLVGSRRRTRRRRLRDDLVRAVQGGAPTSSSMAARTRDGHGTREEQQDVQYAARLVGHGAENERHERGVRRRPLLQGDR